MSDKDEVIVTVVKLLAKAESTSEHEAEALRAKAVALRLKHGISDADLEGGQRDREADQQPDPWGFRHYKTASDLEEKIGVVLKQATAMIAKYSDPDDRAFVMDKLYRVVYGWLHRDISTSLKALREQAVYDCYLQELERQRANGADPRWGHDRAIFHCTMKTDLKSSDVERMVQRKHFAAEYIRKAQERHQQRQKEAGGD